MGGASRPGCFPGGRGDVAMTPLPATFVRTSVLFLCSGFLFGGWMLAAPGLGLPVPAGLRLVHIHFLMVGFLTNMVMGVSLWMFPAPPGDGRAAIARREPWGWAAYGLLLTGLLLRGVLEFVPGWRGAGLLAGLMALSALLQVAAAGAYAVAIWERTRQRTFIRKTTPPPALRPGPGGQELDLTGLPPEAWASAVLQAWGQVAAGEALVVITSRAPGAVVALLTREQPERPAAETLTAGPPTWRVRFVRPPGPGGRG